MLGTVHFKKMPLRYYFNSTYRRKILDTFLSQQSHYFNREAVVLDIGGRDRGRFLKPKENVKQWIFADIEPAHNPDIVLDVSNMQPIAPESIDVILATELFEHVEKPLEGLEECSRVLKSGGVMILSAPFLYPIHGDPFDYQRWTIAQWQKEFQRAGFMVEENKVMGRYFTVMADNIKLLIQSFPTVLKYPLYMLVPLLELFALLDILPLVQNHKILGNFHGGYFFVVRKVRKN